MGSRPDITMSPQEVSDFLASQHRVVVAALDGLAPVGTVASAALVDGELEVTLAPDDPVGALLSADDRVCVIAEQYPSYQEIKGVCAHGRARIVDDRARVTFRLDLADTTSFDFGKIPAPR